MADRDEGQGKGRPLSDDASKLEESIKGTIDGLVDMPVPDAGAAATADKGGTVSPEATGMVIGATIVDLVEEAEELEGKDRMFAGRMLLFIVLLVMVLIALGAAAIAGASIFLREDGGDPLPQPAPIVELGAACVVDSSVVIVDTALTEVIRKADSTQTGYRGAAAFTNTSGEAIYLNLRRSQSTGGTADEGWYDYQIPLAPGETHLATLTGQSWPDRDPTWTVYTKYAAYPATDQCRFEAGGDAALDALAVPVANPLPVGPGSSG